MLLVCRHIPLCSRAFGERGGMGRRVVGGSWGGCCSIAGSWIWVWVLSVLVLAGNSRMSWMSARVAEAGVGRVNPGLDLFGARLLGSP